MSTETRKGGAKKGQVYKKRKAYEVVICPHCLTECRGNIFFRWHGDNCKMKTAEVESDV